MGQRALLIANPRARNGVALAGEAAAELRAAGLELDVCDLTADVDLSQLIQTRAAGVELVIIGGGDGTINGALAGVVATQLPLGILPLGTANDLARTLGIPRELRAACAVIADGRVQRIDLGCVNGRLFANAASIGLSARITRRLTKERKRRLGPVAYWATAGEVLLRYRPFRAEIRTAANTFRVTTIQVTVGNGRYYGGGMSIAADAAIDDQRLDLYSLEVKHWWQLFPLLPAIKDGSLAQAPHVRTFRGEEFQIVTARPRSVNTDGELTTVTPATFRLVPQALAVFVPAGADSAEHLQQA
jgi:YegS/Rv2252/BmrU family lipid kinase